MISNYLKKFYLKDEKLAQRARLEFFRALSSGRMIAFTGAMATEAHGYGSWQQLRMLFSARSAETLTEASMKNPAVTNERADLAPEPAGFDDIRKFDRRSADGFWDPVAGMSMIEELLEQPGMSPNVSWLPRDDDGAAGAWPLDQFSTLREEMRVKLARDFRKPRKEWRVRPQDGVGMADYDVPGLLWRLGIRRFVTPSYDFELERCLMLGDGKLSDDELDRPSPFEGLLRLRRDAKHETFDWDLGSGRIRRVYADGWAIESDMVNRERIDRMIEFAVGTDDVNGHIMHLHGRACNWRSMIVSQRDYDTLYRHNDLNRAPFEFAKRLMMGGNPVLFVGLGMKEEDLNREMREFVSSNPYRRTSPLFVLWNTKADPAETEQQRTERRAALRLEYLTRYGALTIFDADIGIEPNQRPEKLKDGKGAERNLERERQEAFSECLDISSGHVKLRDAEIASFRQHDLHDLAKLVEGLDPAPTASRKVPEWKFNPTLREMHVGHYWRSMRGRILEAEKMERSPILWSSSPPPIAASAPNVRKLAERIKKNSAVAIIGPQGCGKGSVTSGLVALAQDNPGALGVERPEDCLFINGGFAFDTDTLLDGVTYFLEKRLARAKWRDAPGAEGDRPPEMSRQRFMEEVKVGEPASSGEKHVLIVINGMERFCSIEGRPLSSELDELLRCVWRGKESETVQPRVRVVLLGTERVRQYCEQLDFEICDFRSEFEAATDRRPDLESDVLEMPGCYLQTIWEQAEGREIRAPQTLRDAVRSYWANASGRVSGDSIDLRRALFDTLFAEDNLATMLRDPGETEEIENDLVVLARHFLRLLAFIGAPVELAVLRRLPGPTYGMDLGDVLTRLLRCKLVLELTGYIDDPEDGAGEGGNDGMRYALHRSLLTELRYRFGIPLNEAKLSTAFNMALYVAQPIDGDIPDSDIHDELGQAIDALIGSYASPEQTDLRCTVAEVRQAGGARVLKEVARACGHSASIPEDGKMLALCSLPHVQALRAALALVRSYYSTTGLLTLDSGDRLSQVGRDGTLLEHAERLDALIDAYGKCSRARERLRELLSVKPHGEDLFAKKFGLTEPFYVDELVWMHNERGVVRLAMGDLYEAKRSFDQAMLINRIWVENRDRAHNWRRIRLNQLTVDMEMGEIGRVARKCDELRHLVDERYTMRKEKRPPIQELSFEDRLSLAIADGHSAWCRHLRGDTEGARALYVKALAEFASLDQVRAEAYFRRLFAALPNEDVTTDRRIAAIETAKHIAQSGRQMDIVHRVQVTLADAILFGDRASPSTELRQKANRMLEEAQTYAIQADVHRVRCEASMTIARARLQTADYEGALRYAMDAMMVATRYGMELRKITIRSLIAKIMVARGHPVTAERLARTCIKMATRMRFQTAIEKAERVILEIPRVSTSISRSDGSGRRDF